MLGGTAQEGGGGTARFERCMGARKSIEVRAAPGPGPLLLCLLLLFSCVCFAPCPPGLRGLPVWRPYAATAPGADASCRPSWPSAARRVPRAWGAVEATIML